jgi:hypothetical protein
LARIGAQTTSLAVRPDKFRAFKTIMPGQVAGHDAQALVFALGISASAR